MLLTIDIYRSVSNHDIQPFRDLATDFCNEAKSGEEVEILRLKKLRTFLTALFAKFVAVFS
jgi:hypothetical protein